MITAYLPRTAFIAQGDAATELGSSRTALILTAVNTTHERLGVMLNQERTGGRG